MSRRRRGLAGPTAAGIYGAPGGDPRAVPTAGGTAGAGRRWFGLRIRRGGAPGGSGLIPVDSLDLSPDYTFLAQAFDPALADSEVVRRMTDQGWPADAPLLLRHHVRLADALTAEAVAQRAVGDGYREVIEDPARANGDRSGSAAMDQERLPVRLRLSRPQYPTVLSLAQERSRIAGLVARHGGDVEGYDLVVAANWVATLR